MPKKKTEKVVKDDQWGEFFDGMIPEGAFVPKEETKEPEIIITCITINPNGTIFGLANNVIYVYDSYTKTWGKA
jgi:hypothetical protein